MRVGIVGLGNAATSLHLPALATIADAEVVGGVEMDAERRRAAEAAHGLATFDAVDAMLESANPDVVIVATPPDSHGDICLQLLAAGKHVICEKPLASTVEEADRILAAVGSLRLAVNHEFREMPAFKAVRDAIDGSDVGALRFAQIWQLMNLPPWEEAGWRSRMSGRSFYEGGIHLVDYAMYLFGEKPHAVQATVSGGALREDTDAVTTATLHFSRGRIAQVTQNRICTGDTQYFEVRADCEQASLRGSFGGRVRISAGLHRSKSPHLRLEYGMSGLAWTERGHRRRTIARNPGNAPMLATAALLERTLRAFRDGTEAPASGQAGRDVLEVLAACYASIETGRTISIADDAGQLHRMALGAIEGGLPGTSSPS